MCVCVCVCVFARARVLPRVSACLFQSRNLFTGYLMYQGVCQHTFPKDAIHLVQEVGGCRDKSK